MKHLLMCLALTAPAGALAALCPNEPVRLGAHLASWHVRPGYEAATVGLYAQACGGLTAGLLRNSEGRASAYAGKTWHWGPWAVTAGAITGYSSARVSPLLVPSVAVPVGQGWALRLSAIPKARQGGSSALHVSVEISL